jgi:23S rRNA pseudouridine1911/1915/1917 synthase
VREHVARVDARARVGLIHRLDRDAAGLLVFSKSDEAYESLKSQFYHHRVERVYLAVVQGRPQPPRGRIESRLVELADGRVVRTRRPGKGQRAVLEYQVLEALPGRALVRVTLQTGRKHQIRAQLSGRGWPIAGDATYGAKPAAGGLHLCAVRLGFTHPRTGEAVSWEIPPHFRW